MSRVEDSKKLPDSVSSVEDVGNAESTLLGSASSSQWHSSEEPRKPVAIELEQFDDKTRSRREILEDSPYQHGDTVDAEESEQLLGPSKLALNETAGTTDALPGITEPPSVATASTKDNAKQHVSWRSLPKKDQLAILTLARLSEPLTQTSLQSYMFYQLKSFKLADGSSPSDSTVSGQVGLLAAAFTGAQFMTAMMWGRLADSERMGRKRVLLIGLLGTTIGSLGFGFSQSFPVAIFWRAVGGILNGNVGVMRTMISEIVKEKKYQSRAFLLLPMTFNIGVIVGPLLGGLLADPAGQYPGLFGPGGRFGGEDGIRLFERWPYALPNIVSAGFLFGSAMCLIFGLEETLEALRDKPDLGLRLTRWISRSILKREPPQDYSIITGYNTRGDLECSRTSLDHSPRQRQKLPFRRIWTKNVFVTLLSYSILAMHVGGFNNIWFVFLSTPRYNPEAQSNSTATTTANGTSTHQNITKLPLPPGYEPKLPFTFTGGLGLPPPSIGTSLAIMGVIGINLQLLFYPRVSSYLGTITSFRGSMPLFCVASSLAPFLAIIPSTRAPPTQASGILIWISITVVLIVQVLARTFALPSVGILVNNSSPHPSVLGTVHGIAQSASSAARTIGPVLFNWVYGVGLNNGVVGTAWWMMAGISAVGAVAARWVKEGDGHEIWLEGEQEELEEK